VASTGSSSPFRFDGTWDFAEIRKDAKKGVSKA
jgi:hypothetical protein